MSSNFFPLHPQAMSAKEHTQAHQPQQSCSPHGVSLVTREQESAPSNWQHAWVLGSKGPTPAPRFWPSPSLPFPPCQGRLLQTRGGSGSLCSLGRSAFQSRPDPQGDLLPFAGVPMRT